MLNDEDIIRITDHQTYEGESLVNVFFYLYELILAGATLLDVVAEFRDSLLDIIRPIQLGSLTHTVAVIENLTNGIDVDTLVINAGGQDTGGGSQTPSYVAGGWRLNVGDKTTRDGSKRIGGLGENRVNGNDFEPDAIPAALVGPALAEPLVVVGIPVGGGIAVPIIVGRMPITGALDLDRVSAVQSATQLTEIRSQVSRRSAPA